jgi:hypothetical protein
VLAALACSPLTTSSGEVDEAGEGEKSDAQAETSGEEAQPPVDLLIDAPGVDEVTLTTPEEGVGVKPEFAWVSLDGAERYILVVYTPNRASYWSWAGEATSVYMGDGDTPPPEDSAGPVLSPGMWWAVMAFDADDTLIGSSAIQPISP